MIEQSQALTLTTGILIASFFGSWHCAGMCGPIATVLSQRNQLKQYHVGRLFAYVGFGILAGLLGQFFLGSQFNQVRFLSAGLIGFTLIYMGFRQLNWAPTFLRNAFAPINKLIARIQFKHLNKPGWLIGALTVLLPCGWLYTYVIAAGASQSPFAGALIMLLFYLGGLPALLAMPWMIKKTIERSDSKQKKIAGIILIISGVYSLISFFFAH